MSEPLISHHSPRRILTREDGTAIAYRHVPGGSSGVMFRTGLMSGMAGGKALCLVDIARHRRGDTSKNLSEAGQNPFLGVSEFSLS